MKIFLLASLILLSGCIMKEQTIILSHEHGHVGDIMDEPPAINMHGHLYMDDIIR